PIDDRSRAVQWRPIVRSPTLSNRDGDRRTNQGRSCKGRRLAAKNPCRRDCRKTPMLPPRQPRDSASLSIIYCEGTILDSYKPSQYGPRGFGGGNIVILPEPSRVSKAWPTTHAKKVIANNSRPTRLRSPQGLSVSASGSTRSSLTVLPKAPPVTVRRPIRQRSPAVFGSRPSSWPGSLSVRPSAGWLIAGWESRLGG